MKCQWFFIAGMFLCVAQCVAAEDAPTAEKAPGDKEKAAELTRITWLKQHAVRWRSIDPKDDDFADLEPLGKSLGDARIVMLGEQTHGDGATFHAKTRLIKYLHQKQGFDVLVFESGLYDCRKAWELLREGKLPARKAVAQGVFAIWTASEQVQPLIEYLGKHARSARPLELCGCDCQFTAAASVDHLPHDIAALLKKLPESALSAAERADVVAACQRLKRGKTSIAPPWLMLT